MNAFSLISLASWQNIPDPVVFSSECTSVFTADNFFFQQERRRIIFEEEPCCDTQNDQREKRKREEEIEGGRKKKKNNVSFQELGRMIGKRWRNVKPESLVEFTKLAKEDAKRYKEEMKEYYENKVTAICGGYNCLDNATLPEYHAVNGTSSQIGGSMNVVKNKGGKVESKEGSTLDTQYLDNLGRPFISQTFRRDENVDFLQLSVLCPGDSSAAERVLQNGAGTLTQALQHNSKMFLQKLVMQNQQQQQILALMQGHQQSIALDQQKLRMLTLAQSNQIGYAASAPSSVIPCLQATPRLYLEGLSCALPGHPLVSNFQAAVDAVIQSSVQQSARRAHHIKHQNYWLLGTPQTTVLPTAPLVPSVDQIADPINCTSLQEKSQGLTPLDGKR